MHTISNPPHTQVFFLFVFLVCFGNKICFFFSFLNVKQRDPVLKNRIGVDVVLLKKEKLFFSLSLFFLRLQCLSLCKYQIKNINKCNETLLTKSNYRAQRSFLFNRKLRGKMRRKMCSFSNKIFNSHSFT